MLDLKYYQTIVIWGFGREGAATFGYLKSIGFGGTLLIADASRSNIPDDIDPAAFEFLDDKDLTSAPLDWTRTLIVKTPGLSLYDPRLSDLWNRGARFTSQTNLWFQVRDPSSHVIAITGTKGKSTTAKALAHMLSRMGEDVILAGNIGKPVLSYADKSPKYFVVELSSYQIADLKFSPDRLIFLNLKSEHIPWHKTLQNYRRDKLRVAFIDPLVRIHANREDKVLPYELANAPNLKWFGGQDEFHGEGQKVFDGKQCVGEVKSLLGEHNAQNISGALSVLPELGIDPALALATLDDFEPLPHRLQRVLEKDGYVYIDDTIATTPEATLNALAAFPDQDVVLILGGTDRLQDYEMLAEALVNRPRIKRFHLITDNGPRIEACFAPHAELIAKTHFYPVFSEAVYEARDYLPNGGVVLLSPAAPRGSEFHSLEERGLTFQRLVREKWGNA
ncbi:MAG: UDP-N-acetylmuramoyl-L-alanine--D-glutamate ligase [Pseudomonadota bacterium]